MKHLKTFENLNEEDEPIDLVGYPEGNIIEVTPEEMELLEDEFDIRWDDEPDYDEGVIGQWRFMNDEEDEIEEWLKVYRSSGDPELYGKTKKFNL